MKTPAIFCLAAGLALGLAAAAPAAPAPAAPHSGDEIVRVGATTFLTRALPWGPDRAPGGFSEPIEELAFLADGSMVAITVERFDHGTPSKIFLNRVSEAGVVTRIGQVPASPGEAPLDLKADLAGRLYLLTERFLQPDPPSIPRLAQLDPETAAVLHEVEPPQSTYGLAAGPEGLWALIDGRLRTLDPATGKAGYPSWPLDYYPYEIDIDSSGGVWYWQEGVCSPPCYSWYRLDTHTGAIAAHYGPGNTDQQLALKDLAIRRRCQASDRAACLQGGRFRATVTWKDFQGATGDGKAAAGRSVETGLFYFFERKNWELVVKVLNGCIQNGFFWVYGSASTDVEYSLTVEDLEMGTSKTYSNPLGQPSKAITDSTAFACFP
jgi:hypothetical protein